MSKILTKIIRLEGEILTNHRPLEFLPIKLLCYTVSVIRKSEGCYEHTCHTHSRGQTSYPKVNDSIGAHMICSNFIHTTTTHMQNSSTKYPFTVHHTCHKMYPPRCRTCNFYCAVVVCLLCLQNPLASGPEIEGQPGEVKF